MYKRMLAALWREESGQDLIEYALLLAFVALVSVALLSNLATNLNSVWNGVINAASDAIVALG